MKHPKKKKQTPSNPESELAMIVEPLESREMLTTALDFAQEVAYVVNQARHNPQAYATSIGRTGLLNGVQARQALAWNETLVDSATFKVNEMDQRNYTGHVNPDGRGPEQLIPLFGYVIEDPGPHREESLAYASGTFDLTPAELVEALIVDEGVSSLGHRRHLLGWDPISTDHLSNEIGVGYKHTNDGTPADQLLAIHATRTDSTATFLTGVVYNDADGDNEYDAGEGFSSSVVVNGQTIQTNAAGGWSVEVQDGTHVVESQGTCASVNVAGENRQVDFEQGTTGAWVDFTKVGECVADGPPSNITLSRTDINENFVAGLVGQISVTDPTANDTHTFAISDNRFHVVGSNLRLKAGQFLNHESAATVSLNVTATDASNQSFSKSFVITVNDVNERPTGVTLSNTSIAGDEPGATVGTLSVTDPDVGQTHTFSVSDSRFEVAGNQLKLRAGQSLDGSVGSVAMIVTAQDNGGLTRATNFVIDVSHELDTTFELSAKAVVGNTTGAIVGDIRMINELGYSRSDYDFQLSDNRFEVDNSLRLRLKAGVLLDPLAMTSVSLTITASCNAGACADTTIQETIYVMRGLGQADQRGGVLRITGTNGADDYRIFQVGDTTRFADGTSTQFFTGVTHIVVDGMAGDDRISLGSTVQVGSSLYGRSGNDTLIGTLGRDDIGGGTGNDSILSLAGNDRLMGDLGDDALQANEGNDLISGGEGKDRLYAGDGNDRIHGGYGDDILFGMAGIDRAEGKAGNDLVYGGLGNDVLLGGSGNDVVSGQEGNDSVIGDSGNDKVFGGDGHDILSGGEGIDELLGIAGNDRIFGGDGNDWVSGGDGIDTVFAGAGNDRIFGGTGNDSIHGQDGNDELFGGHGQDVLYGGHGDDKLYGSQGSDQLFGSSGNDLLSGGTDSDLLNGGFGDDLLYGMEGADVLIGGVGADFLTGQASHDLLVSGRTDRDNDVAAQASLLVIWNSGASQSIRLAQFKNAVTTISDNHVDVVRGNEGFDAFFASSLDNLDATNSETTELI